MVDGVKKFVPLYVGISKNLQDRLFQHYKEERLVGNSKKELFDFSLSKYNIADVKNIYSDMAIYDSCRGRNKKRYNLSSLIWFNNASFFNHKLSVNQSKYIDNTGHLASITPIWGDLDKNFGSVDSTILKSKIEITKMNFTDNFYFSSGAGLP